MTARVHHAELWGDRGAKYDWLISHDVTDTHWKTVRPQSPFYLFNPQNTKRLDEYNKGFKITDAMPVNSVGIVTGQDANAIDFTSKDARKLANDRQVPIECVVPLLYRPFDQRFVVYHPSLVTRTRMQVMRHMLAGENLGLIYMRQVALGDAYSHFGVSRCAVDNRAFYSNKGIMSLSPLYLYPSSEAGAHKLFAEGPGPGKGGRRPNLSPEFVAEFAEKLGLTFVPDGAGDLKKTFGAEDVFHYAYAVFHSPTYRSRYAQFLKIDFPRLPLTSDRKLFARMCALGAEVVGLHLLEQVPEPGATYPQAGDSVVDKPR
ncbi:MAG: DNA methyltransferase, partial [Planctomycetes bacterium]|nr:DNA methyltransferase [Planctomycetota bacterium]